MQLKSILCPIDFSEFSIRAYQYALSVAEHYDANVVALHVVELWKYPFSDYAACEADYAKFSRALSEGGEVRLREFVKKHTHNAAQPQLVVNVGYPPDSILWLAEAQNIDLIVMGSHGRRGFDRLVLGSTTNRVMRKASCPVLAISKPPHDAGHAGQEGHQVHRLNRVLYCTDFSKNSEGALNYAISAAAEYDAELTLMHVVEHVPRSANAGALLAACEQELDKLIPAEKRKALKVRTAVSMGKPYQEIARYVADARIDMVVMAVRGADALDRAVFGSTTYRVIQLGPCPVLAVHT
jgi:nucleotide-binding universal stress UspA family protein